LTRLRDRLVSVWRGLSGLGQVVTVIGGLSAALGLATAIVQSYNAVSDLVTQRATVANDVKLADAMLRDQDYNAAWNANEAARAIDPRNRAALAQQTRIAMRWLENVRLSQKPDAKTFRDIVEPLESALVRRSITAQGSELADLRTHIGWARFLQSRDGIDGLRIIPEFDDALSVDPANMYAHVMRGFVTAWKGAPIESIRSDLDAAMQSKTDSAYSDRMILSALTNTHTDPYQVAAIDYANRIRKSGRSIDPGIAARILSCYEATLNDLEYLAQVLKIMPADEQVANFDWLVITQAKEPNWTDIVVRAYLMESAGRTAEALVLYRQVAAASVPPDSRPVVLSRLAIRRLTRDPAAPK